MTKQHTPTPVTDPYARITGRVLGELEQGVTPCTKPWSAGTLAERGTRPLRATDEPYTGINVILLWMEAAAAGYAPATWMTYRQAQAVGGQVRRGEPAPRSCITAARASALRPRTARPRPTVARVVRSGS